MFFKKLTATFKNRSLQDNLSQDSLLVVGLGNVGAKYENTRHNVGFMVLDEFVKAHNLQWQEDKKHKAVICKLERNTLADISQKLQSQVLAQSKLCNGAQHSFENVFLLKPQTFMNASGESVGAFAKFYKITNVLVIHDDIDLGFGAVRYKQGGSSGGHNGLKSIDSHFGNAYVRMRVGVGRPHTQTQDSHIHQNKQESVVVYVLSPFTPPQTKNLQTLLSHCTQALEVFLLGGSVAFLQSHCSKHAF